MAYLSEFMQNMLVVLVAANGDEAARDRMLELETAANQAVSGQAALKDVVLVK